jgi:hypothetical protein
VRSIPEAVAAGDLDELVRLVDGLCSAREWERVVELRDRCRHALETRGLQLWPAAEYAEYRLALDATAEFAAEVVTEEAGRFALGPLWEVAASRLPWSDLVERLDPGPSRAMAAHERVLRGEDLSGDDSIDSHVLEVPLRLLEWEPRYATARYKPDAVEFEPPAPATLESVDLPDPGTEIDDDEAIEALIDVGAVWAHGSNGSVRAVAIEGAAEQAIAALGYENCRLGVVPSAEALALVSWATASGGAYGRRRGAPVGRFAAWWLVAALADLEWPPEPGDVERAVAGMRWVIWEPPGFTGGWSACVAIESSGLGLSWAVEALDSWREGEGESA